MSQNGPYPGQGWPPTGGSSGSDEPYTEPSDPWGEAETAASPGWGEQSTSVPSYPQPSYPGTPPPAWQQQQPPQLPLPKKRRNAPIVALVVVLGLLICGGLGTTAVLVSRAEKPVVGQSPTVPAATATSQVAAPEPKTSEDARFVRKGQCVRNQGNADDRPDLKIVECASGTYEVLKRVDGRTTGEADAEDKCGKVAKYTKWYFYDSELDSLDFVLCLREYGAD
ncbi:LppU/SCO3897 family protein [Couchioplanes caeruleus]|uniref:Uncharacterized protein n=1 Tax=Couchioplanes caeruleus TaxID=56438 RepID=A0A3N1GLM3_9ACTN|nr:hypothetical protein [Couchioplanes caeruleus]ROP31163.1 hypothetical protein EDD30_4054 [Couchioplanes caeruleus]